MHEQRWRAAEILRLGLGDGKQLVYARLTRAAQVLSTQQAALLDACIPFRTLEDHARAIFNDARARADQPVQPVSAIREQLADLVAADLLTGESELRDRCFATSRSWVPPPSITTVAVITRNRVPMLRRCLESYAAAARRHDRQVEFLVVDMAPDAATREQTRDVVRAIARSGAGTTRYAGLDERQLFAERLSMAGLPRSAIDFALLPPAEGLIDPGAARNAVILSTLGRLIVCADDDTEGRVAAVPGSTPGLALSSSNDPTETWFFPDLDAALAGAPDLDRDVLAIHEELLGRELGSVLSLVPSPELLRVDTINAGLLRALESGRTRVAVSSIGIHGDAGSPAPPAVRLLDPRSRTRLTQSGYSRLAATRSVQRGVTERTISDSPYLMAATFGLDNRANVPPFFPVCRAQDSIFAHLLAVSLDGACIGHLPYTIRHSPLEPRPTPPDAIERYAAHASAYEIVLACLQSFAPPPGAAAADGLGAVGRHLVALASMTPADFEEFLRLQLWRMKQLAMAGLTRELEAAGPSSPAWAEDARRYLATLRIALVADGYLVPPDLAAAFGGDALPRMQHLIARFGELLECWPAILTAARSLADSGHDLAPRLL